MIPDKTVSTDLSSVTNDISLQGNFHALDLNLEDYQIKTTLAYKIFSTLISKTNQLNSIYYRKISNCKVLAFQTCAHLQYLLIKFMCWGLLKDDEEN